MHSEKAGHEKIWGGPEGKNANVQASDVRGHSQGIEAATRLQSELHAVGRYESRDCGSRQRHEAEPRDCGTSQSRAHQTVCGLTALDA